MPDFPDHSLCLQPPSLHRSDEKEFFSAPVEVEVSYGLSASRQEGHNLLS